MLGSRYMIELLSLAKTVGQLIIEIVILFVGSLIVMVGPCTLLDNVSFYKFKLWLSRHSECSKRTALTVSIIVWAIGIWLLWHGATIFLKVVF